MPQTSVDLSGMSSAQSSFQAALDDTSGAYAQMQGQIEGLQASWGGEAANIYHGAMQQWLNDFSRVNQALGLMLEKLSQNTNVYANTHDATQDQARQAAQQISGGTVGLPGFSS
ncbi:WXG100 family type VII secretion target [Actinacidiphila glaucinigra]|uniref:WXG100 family type VII secretion target n=1 Tax=Actinacidiphila glaucinigra TaxID=235986 RepID=UPI0029AB074A|nr:WXG100 family type VII secretion target [Streptomyces sp. PA03-6a]